MGTVHTRYKIDRVIEDFTFILNSLQDLKNATDANERKLCGECEKVMATNKIGDLYFCDPCRDEIFEVEDGYGNRIKVFDDNNFGNYVKKDRYSTREDINSLK